MGALGASPDGVLLGGVAALEEAARVVREDSGRTLREELEARLLEGAGDVASPPLDEPGLASEPPAAPAATATAKEAGGGGAPAAAEEPDWNGLRGSREEAVRDA